MNIKGMLKKAKEKIFGAGKEKRQEDAEMAHREPEKAQADNLPPKEENALNGAETGRIMGVDMARGEDCTGMVTREQLEAVIEAGEAMKRAFRESAERLSEALMPAMKNLTEIMSKLGKTPVQIRKEELWKRYYEEKAKMTNNERRRRGIPMVKRPKKQQYVTNRRRKRR